MKHCKGLTEGSDSDSDQPIRDSDRRNFSDFSLNDLTSPILEVKLLSANKAYGLYSLRRKKRKKLEKEKLWIELNWISLLFIQPSSSGEVSLSVELHTICRLFWHNLCEFELNIYIQSGGAKINHSTTWMLTMLTSMLKMGTVNSIYVAVNQWIVSTYIELTWRKNLLIFITAPGLWMVKN